MPTIESLKCPECGAPLKFEPEQEYCFCSHCGHQIYKEDVHFDKRMELELEKMRQMEKQEEWAKKMFPWMGIFLLIVLLMLMFIGFFA